MKKKSLNFSKISKKFSVFSKKLWINKRYRKVFICSLVALFAVMSLVVIVINSQKLSSIEKRELNKNSEIVMSYMEEVENAKKIGLSSYVIYAMEYNYNENDSTVLTVKKMVTILESVFNRKFSVKEIEKLGITPDMLDKNISYDPGTKKFSIDKSSYSYADIAQTKIVTYQLQNIKKNGKNRFTAIYEKYVVSNPYEVLNYYDALNNNYDESKNSKNKKKEIKITQKRYDTTDIFNYLTGKEKLKVMKTYITNENVSKFGKSKGTVVVKYVIDEDKILIKQIKSNKNKIKF